MAMAMARRLLSRAGLLPPRRPILTPALARFLSTTDPSHPSPSPEGARGEASEDDDEGAPLPWRSWRPDVAWLSKALEPALQLYNHYNWTKPFAATAGADDIPASTRTLSEILSDLQRSKISIKDWSLSDLTIGLYLIYLSQASAKNAQAFKGVHISCNDKVQQLIYHLELARGCYKGNATGLARHSMLRKRNVLKFVKDSSILRPGYYIAIDPRAKLVILGIRGTHTVYDLVTDLIALSDKKVSPKGFSTHFGTYEAARWYLRHELGIIRKCLEKHKDYKLRLVGHSLGGASAALLAIMLRKKSEEELGFNPDIISAVGFGTPPCVSREIAQSCASYVSTVVLQDDIIPRLSAASLARLRTEILKTDWVSVLEKEDLKHIVDIVTNAKLVVSSIQDVARKLADYAKTVTVSASSDGVKEPGRPPSSTEVLLSAESKADVFVPEDLFLPGTLYYLKRDIEDINGGEDESYTLWRGDAGENFQRILLSGNLISDHKCESIYYALRDVLKTLPSQDHNHHQLPQQQQFSFSDGKIKRMQDRHHRGDVAVPAVEECSNACGPAGTINEPEQHRLAVADASAGKIRSCRSQRMGGHPHPSTAPCSSRPAVAFRLDKVIKTEERLASGALVTISATVHPLACSNSQLSRKMDSSPSGCRLCFFYSNVIQIIIITKKEMGCRLICKYASIWACLNIYIDYFRLHLTYLYLHTGHHRP